MATMLKTKSALYKWWVIALIFGGVLVVYLACWFGIPILINPACDAPAVRGQFGDMFGVVNALFSGLAFAGLIITILIQQHEISEQNTSLEIQRFENTFFNMLSLHRDIIAPLTVQPFKDIFKEIRAGLEYRKSYFGSDFDFKKEQFPSYQMVYKEKISIPFGTDLSTYLQSIASIYGVIEKSKFSAEEKDYYFQIFTTYISQPERTALFYLLTLSEERSEAINKLREMEKLRPFFRKIDPSNFHHASHILLAKHVPGWGDLEGN